MAANNVNIAQKALKMIGANTIAGFDDGTTESDFMDTMYEELVEQTLGEHPWTFASKYYDITANRAATAPIAGFTAKYTIPVDQNLLAVQSVYIADVPQSYDRFENFVHLDASATDTVVMKLIYRQTEENWPTYFRTYFVAKLAMYAAISITRNADVIGAMGQLAQQLGTEARLRDSQSRTAKKVRLTRFASRRR